jgi:hypothetical protein
MKPTTLTPAILMAATLFAATAAHAQSDATAKAYPPGPSAQAWPPGPTAQAYPPGPSGKAAAQTTNVNVANTPTVIVGNEVTVKEPAKELVSFARKLDMLAGEPGKDDQYDVPAGKRLVLEHVNVHCSSTTAQPVGLGLRRSGTNYYLMTVVPPVTLWGTGSASMQLYPVHLLVDDSLTLSAFRNGGTGLTGCEMTLIGYLTPLP